jgi:hypothetical protein
MCRMAHSRAVGVITPRERAQPAAPQRESQLGRSELRKE